MIVMNTNCRDYQIIYVFCVCALFLTVFFNNCQAQYLDDYKVIRTEDEWYKTMDGLCFKAIKDTSIAASAFINMKIDEKGRVLSAHFVKSYNMDSTLFRRICLTIEDCYSTPCLQKTYEQFAHRAINGCIRIMYPFKHPPNVER